MKRPYPTIDIFLGKPVSYWFDVMSVMEEYQIEDVAELRKRLGGNAKSLLVFDASNSKRLLGMLWGVKGMQGRVLSTMWCEPACTGYGYDHVASLASIPINRVDFTYDWQSSEDGFTRYAVLNTTAPLEHLMKLDMFTLPGETRRQAEERRHRAFYR